MLRFLRKMVRTVFPAKDIQTALGIRTCLTEEMLRHIELWDSCYRGSAPWLEEDVQSLHLERSIVAEFTRVALSEMTAAVNDKALDAVFQRSLSGLSEGLQRGLAAGAFVVKPIGAEGIVQYIPQSDFLPVAYDAEKRLTEVVFPDIRRIGTAYYTRLEHHKLTREGLTIRNTAYRSETVGMLGRMIPLTTLADWAELPEEVYYPGVDRPAFGYYRNPVANTVDTTGAGISIFDAAIETICKADRQFGRLDWEYESGERAIHADAHALELKSGKFRMPERKQRLYRGLDLMERDGELFREFSPQLRSGDYLEGLDAYKREIEFQTGLSYGDISNPQSVDKTATEIKAAKQRKYTTVNSIEAELERCLDGLLYALAFYNARLLRRPALTVNFTDSILTDEESERRQDAQDVAMGAMQLWEYRAKWYGEDEATARRMTQADDFDE